MLPIALFVHSRTLPFLRSNYAPALFSLILANPSFFPDLPRHCLYDLSCLNQLHASYLYNCSKAQILPHPSLPTCFIVSSHFQLRCFGVSQQLLHSSIPHSYQFLPCSSSHTILYLHNILEYSGFLHLIWTRSAPECWKKKSPAAQLRSIWLCIDWTFWSVVEG